MRRAQARRHAAQRPPTRAWGAMESAVRAAVAPAVKVVVGAAMARAARAAVKDETVAKVAAAGTARSETRNSSARARAVVDAEEGWSLCRRNCSRSK